MTGPISATASPMTPDYVTGTCVWALRIAPSLVDQTYQLVKVTQSIREFRKINPMGSVPALECGDGGILTKAYLLLAFEESQHPEKNMAREASVRAFYQIAKRIVARGAAEEYV